MGFIKSFLYSILSIQEKFLRARLSRTLEVKNISKRRKIFHDGCMLSLESLADEEKHKMEEELSLILKTFNYMPDKILEYIENQGTPVYYIDNPKALYSAGENEGFFYPAKGHRALYLSMLTGQGFRFKTGDMFILSKGEINKFLFVYHFYNWYAFKHGISGMDSDSIRLLNKYLYSADDDDFAKLQLKDIYMLKDAIKQDKASIEFVFRLCRELEGAKNAFKKLLDEGADV